jgi:glycoside/pentoside/hexuronide:cation symporter, GPH family
MNDVMSTRTVRAEKRQGKLSLSKKTGYGSIEFSGSMVFTCFMVFGMFFFTDIVGLTPAVAGTIVAVGTLWDALAGPFFGIASDSCKNRYGRRRPFILAAALPFCLITWLMFTNWGFGETGTIIYFVIMVIAFFTVIAAVDVPYTAMGAEMTLDYDERTSLNTWRAVFSQIGGLLGGIFPLMIAAYFGGIANDISTGWSYTGLIMGVLGAIVVLYGWRMTRGGELFPDKTHVKVKDILTGPLKNKPFLYVIGFYSMGIMVMALGSTLFVYFLKDYMMYDEEGISTAMAIIFIPTFLWVPIIDYVSKRFSKRLSWLIFASLYLIAILCLYLFVRPGYDITLYIVFFFMSVMAMVPYQIGWSIIPDCVEIDEYKTGARREGLYYGTINFITKGGSALAIFIGGLLLQYVGYNTELAAQTAETMDGVRLILVGGSAIMTILGIVFLALYPLSKAKHGAIVKAIEARKNGEAVDESSFKDCIR